MKWVFASLLLLNIGTFMWGSWYKDSSPGITHEPYPPLNAEKMRPLSDAEVKKRRSVKRSASTAGKPTKKAAKEACASVGPFMPQVQAKTARGELRRLGIQYRLREHVEKTAAGYRVFLPPLGSRKKAEKKRKQLTKLGLKEHYIIEEPGKENAISLGVFSVKRNASALARRLAKKGVKAKQEALYNTVTDYWLDLSSTQKELTALEKFDWKAPGARLRERPCTEVATKKVSALHQKDHR